MTSLFGLRTDSHFIYEKLGHPVYLSVSHGDPQSRIRYVRFDKSA